LSGLGNSKREAADGNKGERTRQRIKAAFAALLDRKSFASITIADICRESDITVGGFYFHFASQDELLNEVMWEYSDGLGHALNVALKAGSSRRVALALCNVFVAAYERQNGLARAFQQLTRMRADYAARWRAANEPRIGALAEVLHNERPGLKPEKARFLAHALVTMVMSQLDLAYVYRGPERSSGRPGREDVARNLIALWARMADAGRIAA
jgi:AcrR family transcriptional regulator